MALGEGAVLWLKEAAAQGTSRIRVKMDYAVSIAKLTGAAASTGRWVMPRCTNGSAKVTSPRSWPRTWTPPPPPARRAGGGEQQQSLTQGTGGWAALGANDNNIAATGGGGSESVSGAATINFHDQQKDI